MLENNPMGSRRRLRFYHRIGVVPIPGEHLDEFVVVPTSLLTDGVPEKDPQEDMVRTTVVSVTTLLYRLLDIVNKMIALAEAEEDKDDGESSDSQDEIEEEAESEAETEAESEAESEKEADVESKNEVENESEAEPQAE